MIELSNTLVTPKHPNSISDKAQWLAGEGAGSWFVILESEHINRFRIKRYSDIGEIECDSLFSSKTAIDLKKKFIVSYPSHCAKVTIIQNNETYLLTSSSLH